MEEGRLPPGEEVQGLRGRLAAGLGLAGKKVALIVETVDFIPIPDSSVRAAAIEQGDVDIAIELNVEDVRADEGASPGSWLASSPASRFDDLRFGFKRGPFSNQKLRQAVRLRDRQGRALCRPPRSGQGKPVSAGFPAGMPFHGSVQDQDPYAKANVRRPSSSCRRPATRARRSS